MNDFQPDQNSIVTLRAPAERHYVTGIRALTRSTAALCNLTVDEIEDLQMAVDEAFTLMLPIIDRDIDEQFTVEFKLAENKLQISIGVHRQADASPDRSGLAWTLLTALAEELDVVASDNTVEIRFSKRRPAYSS